MTPSTCRRRCWPPGRSATRSSATAGGSASTPRSRTRRTRLWLRRSSRSYAGRRSGPRPRRSPTRRRSRTRCTREPVGDARRPVGARPHADLDGADLLDGAAGADVLGPDEKDDVVHEPEGVGQHQVLQLAVVDAAPAPPGEERPADLDLAALGLVAV